MRSVISTMLFLLLVGGVASGQEGTPSKRLMAALDLLDSARRPAEAAPLLRALEADTAAPRAIRGEALAALVRALRLAGKSDDAEAAFVRLREEYGDVAAVAEILPKLAAKVARRTAFIAGVRYLDADDSLDLDTGRVIGRDDLANAELTASTPVRLLVASVVDAEMAKRAMWMSEAPWHRLTTNRGATAWVQIPSQRDTIVRFITRVSGDLEPAAAPKVGGGVKDGVLELDIEAPSAVRYRLDAQEFGDGAFRTLLAGELSAGRAHTALEFASRQLIERRRYVFRVVPILGSGDEGLPAHFVASTAGGGTAVHRSRSELDLVPGKTIAIDLMTGEIDGPDENRDLFVFGEFQDRKLVRIFARDAFGRAAFVANDTGTADPGAWRDAPAPIAGLAEKPQYRIALRTGVARFSIARGAANSVSVSAEANFGSYRFADSPEQISEIAGGARGANSVDATITTTAPLRAAPLEPRTARLRAGDAFSFEAHAVVREEEADLVLQRFDADAGIGTAISIPGLAPLIPVVEHLKARVPSAKSLYRALEGVDFGTATLVNSTPIESEMPETCVMVVKTRAGNWAKVFFDLAPKPAAGEDPALEITYVTVTGDPFFTAVPDSQFVVGFKISDKQLLDDEKKASEANLDKPYDLRSWRAYVERRVEEQRARLERKGGADEFGGVLGRVFMRDLDGRDVYVGSGYSFRHMTSLDRAATNNDWSFGFGNGSGSAEIHVRKVVDDRSKIWDLGDASYENAENEQTTVKGPVEEVVAKRGGVFLIHELDDDEDLWAVLEVLDVDPGRFLVFRWRRVETSEKVLRFERGSDRVLKSPEAVLIGRSGRSTSTGRAFLDGSISGYFDERSKEILSFEKPHDQNEPARGYVVGGMIPVGKAWVVESIRCDFRLDRHSGEGDIQFRIRERLIAAIADRDDGWRYAASLGGLDGPGEAGSVFSADLEVDRWGDPLILFPGDESAVVLRFQGVGAARIAIKGRFVDLEAVKRNDADQPKPEVRQGIERFLMLLAQGEAKGASPLQYVRAPKAEIAAYLRREADIAAAVYDKKSGGRWPALLGEALSHLED